MLLGNLTCTQQTFIIYQTTAKTHQHVPYNTSKSSLIVLENLFIMHEIEQIDIKIHMFLMNALYVFCSYLDNFQK